MAIETDDALPVIVAVGLDFEAEAVSGPGVKVVCGLNLRKYLRELHEQARRGARGIISFGIAGGLLPELRAGETVVASHVLTSEGSFKTCEMSSASLLAVKPDAHYLPVFGSLAPILSVPEMESLRRKTGAATVDMESRDAAEVAAHYGLPYAVLRIVLDRAHRAIPLSALAGADDHGRTDAKAVVKRLAR
jgi:adenosylhomocysteine nucleosidase